MKGNWINLKKNWKFLENGSVRSKSLQGRRSNGSTKILIWIF